MCLKSEYSKQELNRLLPEKSFKAYKFVNKSAGKLTSPHYYYEWSKGKHISDHTRSGEGFYVTYFKPGEISRSGVRIEVTVNPKDVVKAGPDLYGSYRGTCFVVKKLSISEKQWNEANGITVQTIARKGKKLIKKAKKSAAKRAKKVRKLIKKVKNVNSF